MNNFYARYPAVNIAELLEQLCPNGVPAFRLGDILAVKRGKRVVKKDLSPEPKIDLNPVYQNSLIPLGYFPETNAPANSPFVIIAGAAGEIGFSAEPYWAADDCLVLDVPTGISSTFILHMLVFHQQKLKRYVRKASIPRLSRQHVENLPIALPPLEVQERIVEVLDSFIDLNVSLHRERELRDAQLNHYREALLDFDNAGSGDYPSSEIAELIHEQCPKGIPLRKLGECCRTQSGWGFPTRFQGHKNKEIPFVKVGDMNRPGNEIWQSDAENYVDRSDLAAMKAGTIPSNSIVFPKIGAAVRTNKKRITATEIAIDNNVMALIPDDSVSPRYLFQLMQTLDLSDVANDSGAVPSIRKSEMESLLIPLPPLKVQERIVAVLDNFIEYSTNLRREIELRQKQLEYYREQLLTLPTA